MKKIIGVVLAVALSFAGVPFQSQMKKWDDFCASVVSTVAKDAWKVAGVLVGLGGFVVGGGAAVVFSSRAKTKDTEVLPYYVRVNSLSTAFEDWAKFTREGYSLK